MANFQVSYCVTVSHSIEIDAENIDELREKLSDMTPELIQHFTETHSGDFSNADISLDVACDIDNDEYYDI